MTLVRGRGAVHTAWMDSTPTKVLDTQILCSYRGCENQRFAQNRFCLTHYQTLSWALNRSWRDVALWSRWAGAIVVAVFVLVLFIR
jgi:hypothetical protein